MTNIVIRWDGRVQLGSRVWLIGPSCVSVGMVVGVQAYVEADTAERSYFYTLRVYATDMQPNNVYPSNANGRQRLITRLDAEGWLAGRKLRT